MAGRDDKTHHIVPAAHEESNEADGGVDETHDQT